jgi:hypothetical protein
MDGKPTLKMEHIWAAREIIGMIIDGDVRDEEKGKALNEAFNCLELFIGSVLQ